MNDVNRRSGSSALAPAVVITGGTEGIGRALAQEFARTGHSLLLVARDDTALARAADELSSAHGVTVKVVAQDLSTAEGCAGVEQSLQDFGLYAEILVNNAGMMSSGFFQDEDHAMAMRLVDLDIRAVVDLTQRFLPGMVARGRGGVLNVASMMGLMPVPYQAVYAAAKAFMLSFSKALAYETMGTGVTVSVLAPGVVGTRIHAKAGMQNSYYLHVFPNMTPEQAARKGYSGFNRGRSVILPSFLNRLGAFAMRFVPDFLLVPLMGLLFRERDEAGSPLGPGPLPAARTKSELPARAPCDD